MAPGKKSTQNRIGKIGEQFACDYLIQRGYEILYRNVYSEHGEIDIVARKDGGLHFIGVKTRRTQRFGYPEEAVDAGKQQHMINSALFFMQAHPELDANWQLDVIAVRLDSTNRLLEIRMIENAVQD